MKRHPVRASPGGYGHARRRLLTKFPDWAFPSGWRAGVASASRSRAGGTPSTGPSGASGPTREWSAYPAPDPYMGRHRCRPVHRQSRPRLQDVHHPGAHPHRHPTGPSIEDWSAQRNVKVLFGADGLEDRLLTLADRVGVQYPPTAGRLTPSPVGWCHQNRTASAGKRSRISPPDKWSSTTLTLSTST